MKHWERDDYQVCWNVEPRDLDLLKHLGQICFPMHLNGKICIVNILNLLKQNSYKLLDMFKSMRHTNAINKLQRSRSTFDLSARSLVLDSRLRNKKYTNGFGHVIKVAAMPIYDKTALRKFSPEPEG